MKIWGSADILNEKEMDLIENGMFEIFSEVGFKVEHTKILNSLKEAGAIVKNDRVLFSRKWLTNFLIESKRVDIDYSGNFDCWAGGFPQFYLPPGKKTPVFHTLESCEIMVKIADYLENIDVINSCMGIPGDIDGKIMELYQRLLVWKYFKKPKHFIQEYKPFHKGVSLVSSIEMCPLIFEMAELMKTEEGGEIQDYCFADLYLISPLFFDKLQGDIFWYLYEKGCHSDISTVLTLGGSAPVTFSAALPLQLAEIIFCNILQRIFFNINIIHMTNILAPLDMKTGLFQYGRPELSIGILAMGQLARRYGALFSCGSYYCDAKLPSSEAGMQKALSAVSCIFAGATGIGVAGLLSVDEVSSPEQLIIDSEFAGALKKFARSSEITVKEEDLEMIKRVGPGGNYFAEMHTVKHFKELWEPNFFSGINLSSWLKNDCRIDVDYAREIYKNVRKDNGRIYIKDSTEKSLINIIKKAESKL